MPQRSDLRSWKRLRVRPGRRASIQWDMPRCLAGINMAADAGFSMIAHCVFAAPDESYVFDEATAEKLVEKGVWNNPTLAIWESRLRLLRDKAEGQELSEEEKQEVAKYEHSMEERADECGRLRDYGWQVRGRLGLRLGRIPLWLLCKRD